MNGPEEIEVHERWHLGRRARRRGWAAALVLLAPAVACVHATGTADHPAVVKFRIEGLKHLDEGDLKKRLATQESPTKLAIPIVTPIVDLVLGSPKSKQAQLVDPAALAVDRLRVEAYSRNHGYYDAEAMEPEVVPVGDGQANVILRVQEGEPVRVSRVDIEGLADAPQAAAALTRPALRVGDVFTLASYDGLRDQIAAALANNGWASAQVAQEAQVLPGEHTALVRYTVRAGRRYRFGPVTVAGTRTTSAARVGDRVAEEIRPGEQYDERKLVRAQARVFGMGVYDSVQVSRGTADPEAGLMPVMVTVREGSFHRVRLGPTVTVMSTTRVELAAVAGWTNRNFFGGLRRLDLSITAGYAWLLAAPQNEGFVGGIAADFSQPALHWKNVDLGVHLELQRALQQGYDYWAQIARFALPIRLSRSVTFTPSYNLQLYELSETISTIDPNDPNSTNKLLQSCPQTICLLSYLQQRIDYDGRDDVLNTRSGVYLSLAVQEGWRIGGYGYQYVQLLPEARAYFPVGERSVVAARARVGAFIPVGESELPPTVALFFAGGANSMRGYGQERLSPMRCVTSRDPVTGQNVCSNEWVPEGGNGLAEYSLEYRFPIRRNVFGVVFTDAAYVSRRSTSAAAFWDAVRLANLQWAVGFGLRLRTPVGPIRFDVGARLPNDLSADVEFHDRFPPVPPSSQVPDPGPHREPILVAHLSIGEAF